MHEPVCVEICVGSSCHLKGSAEIVEKLQKYVADNHLEDEIILMGSFCTGRCNREGVTIIVNEKAFTGLTPGKIDEFIETEIMSKVGKEGV